MCVFKENCHTIYSGRQTCGRTSRVTQKEGHTGFLHLPSAMLALIFLAKRIQPSLSLVDREVDFLCTHELIVLHLLGMIFYIIIFIFWEEKSQCTLVSSMILVL